ncbi:AIPR family protein [Pseudorhodoferax sp.]|uniref:AIPR family protein n=1 Tax=Pseudorhodoferax sp. TaxID=1993553 RepID=UPI0039E49C16
MVTGPRSLEIQQLENFLKQEFAGAIDGMGHGKDKERNFLSKTVAAFFLMLQAGASKADAIAASIDGGGDHGIDSVYVSPTNVLWLVQSKYIHEGVGEPSLGEASLFRDGVRDFVAGRFERFNQALKAKLPQIRRAMDGPHQMVFALVYTGTSIDDTRRTMFGDLEGAINAVQPKRAQFRWFGLSGFHEALIRQHGEPEINDVELELHHYGMTQGAARVCYGTLRVRDLARLYQDHAHALVRANIRRYKGSSEVNAGMTQTLRTQADHFFCFNNGVTFLCRSITAVGTLDDRRNHGRFRLNGVSIINGAQTAGTVAQEPLAHYDEHPADVLATVIELPGDDGAFADAVTEYRNSQNAVRPQDFVALDDNQEYWRKSLMAHGVTYIYKPSEADAQATAPMFTVEEAAGFCAARDLRSLEWVLHHPERLWDRHHDVGGQPPQANVPFTSAYKSLFHDTLSCRKLWRLVQIGRQVQQTIQQDADAMAEAEPLKAEEARASSWLVTHLVFVRLHALHDGETLNLTQAEALRISQEVDAVRAALAAVYSAERIPDAEPSVSFTDMACLSRLKNATMARLAAQNNVPA